jgi:hypothetical protein
VTDANLMDADCIHGTAWWDCTECWDELNEQLAHEEATDLVEKPYPFDADLGLL